MNCRNTPDAGVLACLNRDAAGPRAVLAACLALALAAPWTGSQAGGRDDHERARQAVASGEVLPWPQIAQRIAASHPGELLELELEREDGRWIYEVRLLQPGGRILKLELDARTGELLRQRRAKAPH